MDQALSQAAGQTLLNIVEYRPKLVAKQNLVVPIISSLVTLIAESKVSAAGALYSYGDSQKTVNDDDDEDDDEDYSPEMSKQELAQTCLDSMALHISPKHFVQPALAICAQVGNLSLHYSHVVRFLVAIITVLYYSVSIIVFCPSLCVIWTV